MRHFSLRPSLTLRGRTFKGLRGWSGKPLHPPLTDIPVGAYAIALVLDLISFFGRNQSWSREVYLAATYVLLAGVVVALLTALTGLFDWRTTTPGTQVRRTATTHGLLMASVTVIVVVDLVLRIFPYRNEAWTPGGILVLTAIATAIMAMGAALGGGLVYEHGFNVETAGDSRAWHRSEVDQFPGEPEEVVDLREARDSRESRAPAADPRRTTSTGSTQSPSRS